MTKAKNLKPGDIVMDEDGNRYTVENNKPLRDVRVAWHGGSVYPRAINYTCGAFEYLPPEQKVPTA